MLMRRPHRFAPAAVLGAFLSLALTARGEEPKHDLSRVDRWQAGDVRTRTVTTKEKRKIEEATEGGTPQVADVSFQTSYVLVEKILEADAEGRPTRILVHVKDWRQSAGGAQDTSLVGTLVEVNGRGKDRTWRQVGDPPAPPSQTATQWLNQAFGFRGVDGEALERAVAPPGLVALGEGWTIDGKRLAPAYANALPIDGEKTSGKAKLLKVEDGVATVDYELALAFQGLPGQGGALLPWASGGTMQVAATRTRALTGRVAARTATVGKRTLQGVAQGDGRTVTIDVTVEEENRLELGGEMPAGPAKSPDAPK